METIMKIMIHKMRFRLRGKKSENGMKMRNRCKSLSQILVLGIEFERKRFLGIVAKINAAKMDGIHVV